MFKSVKLVVVLLVSTFVLNSCGKESVGKAYSDEACGCVVSKIDGLNVASIGMNAMSGDALKSVSLTSEEQEKLMGVLKKLKAEVLKENDPEAQKQIIRGFLKGLVDSQCADKMLDKGLSLLNLTKQAEGLLNNMMK